MQNPKMLSRLLATAVVSFASVAAVSVHAADPSTGAATIGASTGASTGAPSGATTGASGYTGAGASAATAPGAATSPSEATTGAAAGVSSAPSTASAPADDATITTMVKAALTEDKKVKSLKISVSTEQGVVKMSGTVPNAEVGKRALELAAAVQGVKDVKNNLKVKAKG